MFYKDMTNNNIRLQHDLVFRNDIGELPRVEAFLDGIESEFSIGAVAMNKIRLAVEELVVNVIKYAYPENIDGEIALTASLDGRMLTIEIADCGVPFNPTAVAVPDTNAPLEERPIGGLGIHLAKNMVDEMDYEYRDGYNVLSLKKLI